MKIQGVTNREGLNIEENLYIEGVSNIDGDITCFDCVIEGVSKIRGNLNCNKLNIKGVSNVGGNVKCENVTIEGTSSIYGNIKTDEFSLKGLVKISGNVESEKFTGSGSFNIDGELNADTVDVYFVYGSNVRTICGREIRIRKEKHFPTGEFFMKLIKGQNAKFLATRSIEADYVDVDWTQAEIVRGTVVKIGADCVIDRVEYHESADIDPKAIVKSLVKI